MTWHAGYQSHPRPVHRASSRRKGATVQWVAAQTNRGRDRRARCRPAGRTWQKIRRGDKVQISLVHRGAGPKDVTTILTGTGAVRRARDLRGAPCGRCPAELDGPVRLVALGERRLGAVEPGAAVGGQGLAPLPQAHALLQADLATLELGDDRDQLVPRLLVGQLGDVGEVRSASGTGWGRWLPPAHPTTGVGPGRRPWRHRTPDAEAQATGRTPKSPRATRTRSSSSASTSRPGP